MNLNLQRDQLEQLYIQENLSSKKIGELFGVNGVTILNYLRRYQIPVKKKNGKFQNDFYVNNNFFEIWTSDMAYVLGYIVSDGCVRDKKYEISIKSIDYELLEYVKNKLETNYDIKTCKNSNCYVLSIYSGKIVKDLFMHGITPRKSLTIRLPKIPEKYFWDFLRGVVDGDGHVRPIINGAKTITFQITGCRLLLKDLLLHLNNSIDCPNYCISNQGRAGVISLSGKYAYLCLKNMYNNEKYGLSRKKNMALRLIENYERPSFCNKCGLEMKFVYVNKKYCSKCMKEINNEKRS